MLGWEISPAVSAKVSKTTSLSTSVFVRHPQKVYARDNLHRNTYLIIRQPTGNEKYSKRVEERQDGRGVIEIEREQSSKQIAISTVTTLMKNDDEDPRRLPSAGAGRLRWCPHRARQPSTYLGGDGGEACRPLVSQRDGDSQAQMDRHARARARPNGSPLPGPQERPRGRRGGARGGG